MLWCFVNLMQNFKRIPLFVSFKSTLERIHKYAYLRTRYAREFPGKGFIDRVCKFVEPIPLFVPTYHLWPQCELNSIVFLKQRVLYH